MSERFDLTKLVQTKILRWPEHVLKIKGCAHGFWCFMQSHTDYELLLRFAAVARTISPAGYNFIRPHRMLQM